jgi:hypothetical protein
MGTKNVKLIAGRFFYHSDCRKLALNNFSGLDSYKLLRALILSEKIIALAVTLARQRQPPIGSSGHPY